MHFASRQLQERIQSMLYERTAISKKPEQTIHDDLELLKNEQKLSPDLLFYHRRLKCLIAIDLKIGEFEAGFKGQMELYLRYLEKHEQVEGENSPIGLILCAGKNEEHIELLQLDKSNIRVADYLTALPPQKLLQEKLHKAVEIAQQKLTHKDHE